jgi:hypothetical protein
MAVNVGTRCGYAPHLDDVANCCLGASAAIPLSKLRLPVGGHGPGHTRGSVEDKN